MASLLPMKYDPMDKPTDPGFYWLVERGGKARLVEVCIESDSHNMFYVLLPGDDCKYALEIWSGAVWFGPVDEIEEADVDDRSRNEPV